MGIFEDFQEAQKIEQKNREIFNQIDESTDSDFVKEAKKQIILHAKLLERLKDA
jgi:hypothetical protein